jgi:putative peptidoglycan lipid II flippase
MKNVKGILTNSVGGGAIIIAIFSILSRLLGLLRDRLLTKNFGASEVLDAYYAAFRLPDLVFNTLVLGALSSAFIPIFLEVYSRNKKEAWLVANSVLNILFIIILFFVIVFFVLAPLLINLIVPGFNLETKILTLKLTRVMLIGILFFTFSNVVSSILNSFRRFFAFSIAPVMYNLGIISGILFFVPNIGPIGLAWGVVFGSFLHLLSQLPSLFQTGYHWQPSFNWLNPAVRKIGFLMLPRCFGLAISQFNLIVTTLIASTLISGTIAIYNLAFNLVSFPINIFGTALAVAVFPVFSRSLVDGQKDLFIHHFSKTFRRILYLIIPTTVIFILLKTQIVYLIFKVGKFGLKDTILTAQTLCYFSISLFAQSLIPVLARAFYAKKDTITPVKIAVLGLVTNLIGCLILGPKMGVAGLALAFSLSSIINFLLLFIIFKKEVGDLDDKRIFRSSFKIVCLSILMAFIIQFVKQQTIFLINPQTFLGNLIQFLAAFLIGGLTYFILSLIFECEEIWVIKKYLKF